MIKQSNWTSSALIQQYRSMLFFVFRGKSNCVGFIRTVARFLPYVLVDHFISSQHWSNLPLFKLIRLPNWWAMYSPTPGTKMFQRIEVINKIYEVCENNNVQNSRKKKTSDAFNRWIRWMINDSIRYKLTINNKMSTTFPSQKFQLFGVSCVFRFGSFSSINFNLVCVANEWIYSLV